MLFVVKRIVGYDKTQYVQHIWYNATLQVDSETLAY